MVEDDDHPDDIFEQGFFELQRERDAAPKSNDTTQTINGSYNGPIIGHEITSPYHKIFDDLDQISMSIDKLADGQLIKDLKVKLLQRLKMPHVNDLNPNPKSLPERMSVRNEIKSFCSFDQDALERGLKLHRFEDMMKREQQANEASWKFIQD